MLRQLRLGLLALLTFTAVLPLAAQVRHVTTVNPQTKQSYIEVYEYDYVDIQPQFPGGERGLINFINKPVNTRTMLTRIMCKVVSFAVLSWALTARSVMSA